ncbi:hypothetical protein L7F22_042338 [Adiantum nelumboides]|nr:hypothetical protein [Adiantum nelumboides]
MPSSRRCPRSPTSEPARRSATAGDHHRLDPLGHLRERRLGYPERRGQDVTGDRVEAADDADVVVRLGGRGVEDDEHVERLGRRRVLEVVEQARRREDEVTALRGEDVVVVLAVGVGPEDGPLRGAGDDVVQLPRGRVPVRLADPAGSSGFRDGGVTDRRSSACRDDRPGRGLRRAAVAGGPAPEASSDPGQDVGAVVGEPRGRPGRRGRGDGRRGRRAAHPECLQHQPGGAQVPGRAQVQAVVRPVAGPADLGVAEHVDEGEPVCGGERAHRRRQLGAAAVDDPSQREPVRRVGAAEQYQPDPRRRAAVDGAGGQRGEPGDVGAGPQHVVPAPVERDQRRCGVQRQRGVQLWPDDVGQQPAPYGQVRVVHRFAGGAGQPGGDPVGPAAGDARGVLVAHALGEAVPDRHVPHGISIRVAAATARPGGGDGCYPRPVRGRIITRRAG